VAGLEIRAERSDEEPGRTLLEEFTREVETRYPGSNLDRGPSATPAELAPPGGCFLVAYSGAKPVGCGAVKRVYVRPAARGQGISRRLLARLEDAAREAGYTRVRLDTGERQPEAQALFRSSGYVEIPDYNVNPFAALWFEKRLDPRA
jgi:GNAT superfamily N-acetyltransferase